MGRFYDDSQYGVSKVLQMRQLSAQTSVMSADVVVARHTFMEAVTVTDWNLVVKTGDVLTGVTAAASWNLVIGKSLGGTGAVSPMGTARMYGTDALGGTHADNSVLDAACTSTNFVAGDDIVLQYLAGTALPAGAIQVDADVKYVERYT